MKRVGRFACGLRLVFTLAVAATPASATEDNPLAFAVIVSLSPAAADRLVALNEGITVSASYFGDATAAARKEADDLGQISLGEEQVGTEVPGGPVFFSGATVDRRRIARIKGRNPMVNVNVFSSRRNNPDNLLACDIYEGAVATAAQSPSKLHCKLIGEN